MKTTRKVMVEKEITTWKCDLCNFTTENNRGCCGVAPIMTCRYCKKHVCREHRHFMTEDYSSDYPIGDYVCDDCYPDAKLAWNEAEITAGRYESILEVWDRIYNDKDYMVQLRNEGA